ncbi:MAG: 2-oxoacid:acceptor oxidoreductase subunit alpha [Myxococcales bacterium]|nr:2-oxoacid:acceptor oxidoreductase subunit alpha [Myxococcales bacterium]
MQREAQATSGAPVRQKLSEATVEIVSDSGEGAQKAGQTFGAVSAKMGNGVWTVEIIPAEIKPPARSRAGASGIRVRFGTKAITNMGDHADLVVALNEQVLYGRLDQKAYKKGTVVLLESKWATDGLETIRTQFAEALERFEGEGLRVIQLPIEAACGEHTDNPRVGKNMFVLGMLCHIFDRDIDKALNEVKLVFGKKGEKVVAKNQQLLRAGLEYAAKNLDLAFHVPSTASDEPKLVMNGNQALGLGVMAAGMEVVSMYPITPATSASHHVAGSFHKMGGLVHQAEDEIAAVGFAIGASYAGKTACTITSGPGLALKTEFLGLAVMAEVPLVVVVVQRGGPSTGLPTKVEQGDLLAVLYGEPGDAPKVVMAAATIEECFHMVITARRLAEAFRTPVIVLTDANLATGVQPIRRPELDPEWLAPPIDQSPWPKGLAPYAWDETTGLSPRPVPGQKGGEYVLTGLAHTQGSKVAYDPESNERGLKMRSRKLASLQQTLQTPEVHGDPEGDLLVVGWGSTLGAIEEAVDRMREQGHKVSSLHLRMVSPLPLGLNEIFSRFNKVMTVEINYSDPKDEGPYASGAPRRRSQLAWLLRAETLVDIESWSRVQGQPLQPLQVEQALLEVLEATKASAGGKSPVTA